MPNQRRLRSASSNQLDIPSFRLPTVGSRAFPTAGAKVWNSLPDDVTSAPSLSTFRRYLKTYLLAAVTTLSDTAHTYSDYSGPRGGVAAKATQKNSVMMMMIRAFDWY